MVLLDDGLGELMAGDPLYPGGVSRGELELRLQRLRLEVRKLASDVASQATSTVTQLVAKTVSVLNYSDLQGIPASFSPSQHASRHAVGGSDPLTAAMIGAADGGLNGGAAVDFFLASADANTETDGIADGGSA